MINDRYLFRAYNPKIKEWLYDEYPNGFTLTNAAFGSGQSNWAIMQCTGLKDKNGKLIFEDDVVKIEYTNGSYDIGTVNWSEDALCYYLVAINESYDDTTLGSWSIDEKLEKGVRYEILGNKWDNPELLEAQND